MARVVASSFLVGDSSLAARAGALAVPDAAAESDAQVMGVEQVSGAVACARRNAEANGVAERCGFVAADATCREKSLKVGLLSAVAAFVQLTGYGSGFLRAWWQRCVRGRDEFSAFDKNFYK